MRVHVLMDSLWRRGVRLRRNGDRLRWIAPVGVVTEADLGLLHQHKAEVLAILREEERDRIEERAAILEFDGGLSRSEAERRAQGEEQSMTGGSAA